MINTSSNFDRLTGRWQTLGKYGQEAAQYVTSDPSVALFKLRLFAETMTDEILRLEGISVLKTDKQVDKLGKLEEEQILSAEVRKIFHNIRKAGNKAAHSGKGTSREARVLLQQASYLASWFAERYIDNNYERKQKPHGNTQQNLGPHKVPRFFVRIRPLLVFIPLVIFIGSIADDRTKYFVAIFFIIYMFLRGRLLRSGYRTTVWTILSLLCAVFISVIGVLDHFTNTTGTEISKYTETVSGKDIIVNLTPENYDATIYINDKPIDTTDHLGSDDIDVGSKVHVEWTFPWGKMKSEPQTVEAETQVMKFEAKVDPQLKKELTDFFNEFAQQCVKARQEADPYLVTLVSGDVGYMCEDPLENELNEKLIETGIDFESSTPVIHESFLSDPILVFGLRAYFKCEVNGETQTHSGYFRLVYHEKIKSWSIKNKAIDSGGFGPETVITKFD